MGKGFKHGAGGSALNYRIAWGTVAPEKPRENTIWVNTSTAITDHVFSVDEPERAEGRIWILVGLSGDASFNALRKNTIMIAPLAAKQCIGGTWVEKTAMSYIGGAWKDWFSYLYAPGDMTGWTAAGKHFQDAYYKVAPTVVFGEEAMTITGSDHAGYAAGGMVYKDSPVNLTDATTLKFTGDTVSAGSSSAKSLIFGVWSAIGDAYTDALVAYLDLSDGSTSGEHSLSVAELSGEYYVGFGLYGSSRTVTMEKMWKE
jgi:hypothetical protein